MTLTCSTYPLTQREQDSIATCDTSLISHDAHVRGRLRMTISNKKEFLKILGRTLFFLFIFFPRGEWARNGEEVGSWEGGDWKGDKSCQRAIVSQ